MTKLITSRIQPIISKLGQSQVKMARYKFPFTKRDKYAVFGGDDRELEELEDQEFYIKGAVSEFLYLNIY